MKFKNFIKSNRFLILIIIILAYSINFPKAGLFVKDAGWLSPLTFIAMFVSGLGLSFDKIKGSFKDYKNIIYSFSSVYLIFPVVIFLLFMVFGIKEGDIFIGGMILAAQSSTLASAVVLTMSANGNVPLALIITIINNMSSALVTPFILKVVLNLNEAIVVDVKAMVIKLLLVLILPVVLAQIIRIFIKKYLKYITPYCKLISKLVVLTIVLIGGASAAANISGNLGQIAFVLLLVVLLHIIMLLLASLYLRMAKVDRESRPAVLFCSSQKTMVSSLLIWGVYFPQFAFAPIFIVSYHLMQLFIDSILVNILNKRNNNMHVNDE